MHRTHPPQFVLFGGSFNPIHRGHLEIARHLAALPGIAQVLMIPAAQSPFKPEAPQLPADLRYRMACAAAATVHGVTVLDCELTRPAPSYTVDTVLWVRHRYPQARLWLAMGMDVFASFSKWQKPDVLLRHAGLLVFERIGDGPSLSQIEPSMLPAAWASQVHRGPEGGLVDDAGRQIVWPVKLEAPQVSASSILQTRDLSQVPQSAQGLLTAYWQSSNIPVNR